MKKYCPLSFFMILFCMVSSLALVAQETKDLRFVQADEVEEGDGAKVRRLIPQHGLKHYDPYVLFDDFSITPPHGFPDHFHSGFEVITYVVQGKLQHKDNQGHTEVLGAGDVQCFTTGAGVVHSEMPQGEEQVRGFQIWINLPKEFKTIPPDYQAVRANQIQSVVINDQVTIKTIVAQGETVRTKAEVLIREIKIKKGGRYALELPEHYAGFVYVASGQAEMEGKLQTTGQAIFFTAQQIQVLAKEDTTLLLVSGLPLQEPIKRKGSIVK